MEKRWQDMCQRFVGDSILAHEFENEPHNPKSFGDYVENLNEQISDLRLSEEEVDKTLADYQNKYWNIKMPMTGLAKQICQLQEGRGES